LGDQTAKKKKIAKGVAGDAGQAKLSGEQLREESDATEREWMVSGPPTICPCRESTCTDRVTGEMP